MGVLRANDVAPAHIVVLTVPKAIHDARGNSQSAQHDSHCRRKIFAMALLSDKQKVRQRITAIWRSLHLQRVTKSVLQKSFQCRRLGVWRSSILRLVSCQLRDAR